MLTTQLPPRLRQVEQLEPRTARSYTEIQSDLRKPIPAMPDEAAKFAAVE